VNSWRVGRIAGAEVLIRPSLAVLTVVLVVFYTPQLDEIVDHPALVATLIVVSLLLSILGHELAHLGAAKIFGIGASRITLDALGGRTDIKTPSQTPAQELLIAIVGPLASALIGTLALMASRSLDDGFLAVTLWSVGVVNLVLAIANMIPGMPLDGGRVLRALIWWITGNEVTGVKVAAWMGRAAAVAAVVWGIVAFHDIFQIMFIALVALFLWHGASISLAYGVRSARVNSLLARRLSIPGTAPDDAPRIAAHLRGRDLLIAMAENPAELYALVDDNGSSHLVLHAHDVDRAYRGDS
jgi:Zn-dependent protease